MNDSAKKCVYGPVESWRLGRSLGVDLLFFDSICSFACVYCQLGKINRIASKREVFVPTSRVMEDLRGSDWKSADVITFSGSGEPTLALNLGEVISEIRALTAKPIIVLTNSSLLADAAVRREISLADKIFCKLDAWSEDGFRRVDRPTGDISLRSVTAGIMALRAEYSGFLAIQTMLLSQPDERDLKKFADILSAIAPDEVQLNLPLRAVPGIWSLEFRGNAPVHGYVRKLRSISPESVAEVARTLKQLTGLPVISPCDSAAVSEKRETLTPRQNDSA